MHGWIGKLILAFFVAVQIGCAPRGETKSLEEILQQSKARFAKAEQTQLSAEMSKDISELGQTLQVLLSSTSNSDYRTHARTVSSQLLQLTRQAGFTTRPALGEISSQYRSIAFEGEHDISAAQVKLLVARTYRVLARELETTAFAVG